MAPIARLLRPYEGARAEVHPLHAQHVEPPGRTPRQSSPRRAVCQPGPNPNKRAPFAGTPSHGRTSLGRDAEPSHTEYTRTAQPPSSPECRPGRKPGHRKQRPVPASAGPLRSPLERNATNTRAPLTQSTHSLAPRADTSGMTQRQSLPLRIPCHTGLPPRQPHPTRHQLTQYHPGRQSPRLSAYDPDRP